jgi:hypothetical protein
MEVPSHGDKADRRDSLPTTCRRNRCRRISRPISPIAGRTGDPGGHTRPPCWFRSPPSPSSFALGLGCLAACAPWPASPGSVAAAFAGAASGPAPAALAIRPARRARRSSPPTACGCWRRRAPLARDRPREPSRPHRARRATRSLPAGGRAARPGGSDRDSRPAARTTPLPTSLRPMQSHSWCRPSTWPGLCTVPGPPRSRPPSSRDLVVRTSKRDRGQRAVVAVHRHGVVGAVDLDPYGLLSPTGPTTGGTAGAALTATTWPRSAARR